jgi:hypothetical protein
MASKFPYRGRMVYAIWVDRLAGGAIVFVEALTPNAKKTFCLNANPSVEK